MVKERRQIRTFGVAPRGRAVGFFYFTNRQLKERNQIRTFGWLRVAEP